MRKEKRNGSNVMSLPSLFFSKLIFVTFASEESESTKIAKKINKVRKWVYIQNNLVYISKLLVLVHCCFLYSEECQMKN